jgi:DNA mismatch endonuclease (patch repair protein)
MTGTGMDRERIEKLERLKPIAVPASPPAVSEASRKVMQANRSRDTSPELALRRELHRRGLRYFVHRRPLADLRCTADIVFPRKRLCVFVDGCFWHGCPVHSRTPKSNESYWSPKIARNAQRDRRNDVALAAAGWVSLRFWEHEIRVDPAAAAGEIAAALRE